MAAERAPYFPFYYSDFIHGVRASRMTPEEIGAFVVLMCAQWEQQGPIKSDPRWLSGYSGWDVRVVRRLSDRLVELGKFQRQADTLYNERMTTEITKFCTRMQAYRERERKAKEAKLQKGCEELPAEVREKFGRSFPVRDEKINEINETPPKDAVYTDTNTEEKKEDMRISADGGPARDLLGSPLPEQEPKKRAPAKPKATADQWNRFWSAYPKRKGKAEARAIFERLDPESAEAAIAGAKAYAAEVARDGTEQQFVKWAQGWLNQQRWADYEAGAEPTEQVDGKAWGWWEPLADRMKQLPYERWQNALRDAKPNGTWPWWKLGPPPGHPECLVHPDLVAELKLDEIYKGQITHD